MQPENERPRLTHYEQKLLSRLSGNSRLCARTDATEDGIQNGGLAFWIEPTGKTVGPKSARGLIDKGYVAPLHDGLLEDTSQSWRLAH